MTGLVLVGACRHSYPPTRVDRAVHEKSGGRSGTWHSPAAGEPADMGWSGDPRTTRPQLISRDWLADWLLLLRYLVVGRPRAVVSHVGLGDGTTNDGLLDESPEHESTAP